MNIDPVLLRMGCSYAMKAYDDEVANTIKIESRLTSTTVFIAKRKSIDIIAFRGTQQVRDWLFNLSAIPVPYAGRLCHSGFVMAHSSVWRKIKKHIHPKKRTLICGHSLGGALAELSAAKLHKKHPNINLVTFGKPNVFFKGFKRPMSLDKQYSLISGSDMVARVPRLCYGPSSSQTVIYFSNAGEDCIDPTKAYKHDDFMSEKGEAISDHFMEGYKDRLDCFLDDWENRDKPKKETTPIKPVETFTITTSETKEINELLDEVEKDA